MVAPPAPRLRFCPLSGSSKLHVILAGSLDTGVSRLCRAEEGRDNALAMGGSALNTRTTRWLYTVACEGQRSVLWVQRQNCFYRLAFDLSKAPVVSVLPASHNLRPRHSFSPSSCDRQDTPGGRGVNSDVPLQTPRSERCAHLASFETWGVARSVRGERKGELRRVGEARGSAVHRCFLTCFGDWEKGVVCVRERQGAEGRRGPFSGSEFRHCAPRASGFSSPVPLSRLHGLALPSTLGSV